jgi:hypothetical protein
MRRILCALAVPGLVIALLVAPSTEASAAGGPALRHPPTCC